MNRFIVLLVVVLGWCGVLSTGHATTAASKPEESAQAAAEAWLPLVDGGKYAESWEKMAPSFKQEVPKARWVSTIAEIRKPFGKQTSRKFKSAEYSKELPGAPEGEYVVLKYETAFEKKPAAEETVIAILNQDLTWYVTGYSVK